jgi:hypothetical protein
MEEQNRQCGKEWVQLKSIEPNASSLHKQKKQTFLQFIEFCIALTFALTVPKPSNK